MEVGVIYAIGYIYKELRITLTTHTKLDLSLREL